MQGTDLKVTIFLKRKRKEKKKVTFFPARVSIPLILKALLDIYSKPHCISLSWKSVVGRMIMFVVTQKFQLGH